MRRGVFSLAVVVVVALTVLSGVLTGRMTNRWGPSVEMLSAADRLNEFPHEFGDWRMTESEELSKTAMEQLQPAGYFVRTYQNSKTGDAVNLTLLLGRPGPISVHTPEVCFGCRNFNSRTERRKIEVPTNKNNEDEFWTIDFQIANQLEGGIVQTCYAWSPGDSWQAPKDARFWSAGFPYLYKIQLVSILPPGSADSDRPDPCRVFLADFVPAARRYLAPPIAK